MKKPTRKKPEKGRPRSEAKALPIYESQGECAGQTGIPISIIRQARREGCQAFRSGNRVELGELLKWLFAEDRAASATNWGLKLDEYRAKREEIKLKKEQSTALDADEVRDAVAAGVAMLFAEQERLFLTELPPALKGMDEVTIRARCETAIASMKIAVLAKLEPLTA